MDDSRLAFLGLEGLRRLRELRVVVIGAGGSGSHIVQQLAHLRVQSIVSVDPDVLERSNVNRVVLSSYNLVGSPKAEILERRLRGLRTDIEPIVDRVETADAIAAVQSADICFGAVDHWGTRNLIEYFARMALVPVIDVGMQITLGHDGRGAPIASAGGQVVTSLPAGACFRCMGFLTEELLTRERVDYAGGNANFVQQVISINGVLASQAVTNMLGLFAGFAGPAGVGRYISYNALTQSMSGHPNLIGIDLDSCEHYHLEDAGLRPA
jgi:hypothetical protein